MEQQAVQDYQHDQQHEQQMVQEEAELEQRSHASQARGSREVPVRATGKRANAGVKNDDVYDYSSGGKRK